MRMAIFVLLAIIAPACGAVADEPSGEALYREHCAQCHEAGIARAPSTAALKQMSPYQIAVALMFGSMSAHGRDLSGPQVKSLLRYLVSAGAKPEAPLPDASCHGAVPLPQDVFAQPYWNGWGVDISQHRFQRATMAQLSAEDVPRLKLKWAFAFPGDASAFAQPTVVGGRIFVGSAGGKVYSLDAQTGCVRWVFDAEFEVRTAISIVPRRSGWSALFGNVRADVFAVDAETGKLLWKTHAAEHPASIVKGAPTLAGTTLYVPLSSAEEVLAADPHYQCCTFRGGVTALDAETGKLLWQGHAIAQAPQQVRKNKLGIQLWGPSGAAIWSSPTIDTVRRMVYVTTGDSYSDPAADTSDAFVAFEMETGKLAWFRQMTTGDTFNVGCEIATPVNCPQVKDRISISGHHRYLSS
jgi:polyvinyl alcohol dehydrogenase (cytochrome)